MSRTAEELLVLYDASEDGACIPMTEEERELLDVARRERGGLRVPSNCLPPHDDRPVLALAPSQWDGWEPVFYGHNTEYWYSYEGQHQTGLTPVKGVVAWMEVPIDNEVDEL